MAPGRAERRRWAALRHAAAREATGLFLAEGEHLVREALAAAPERVEVVLAREGEVPAWLAAAAEGVGAPVAVVRARDFAEVSGSVTPPPVLAVARVAWADGPAAGPGAAAGIALGLDAVGDPGNVGTLLRAASWFGAAPVLLGPGSADPHNPKAVQASMGAIFRVPVARADLSGAAVAWRAAGRWVAGTFLDGDPVPAALPAGPGLLLLGNEARGLVAELGSVVTHRLAIPSPLPPARRVESLNVAMAGTLLLGLLAARRAG